MIEVTLYTRAGCTLCNKAKAAILAAGVPVRITEVDIDRDDSLREKYTDDVPVIHIDGKEAFRHHVNAEAFLRYTMSTLKNEKCVPCRGGVPALKGSDLDALLSELGSVEMASVAESRSKSVPVMVMLPLVA